MVLGGWKHCLSRDHILPLFSSSYSIVSLMHTPRIAVIYLSFHCDPYLPDLIPSLEKVTYPKDRWALVIPDNPHPTHGLSMSILEKEVLARSEKSLPRVILLPQEKNLGFSRGNNAGIRWALEHGYDYVYLLNNDALPEPGFLEPLVDAIEKDKSIGCAQSLITLYPRTDLLNTNGNAYHFLGFGYSNGYLTSRDQRMDPLFPINYASGAGALLRSDLLENHGLWDEDFWMYHEDLEYSLRLKMHGYSVVCVRDSVIGHKYEFSRSITKFQFMERNRYATLLMFYKLPTLLLLLPALLGVELAMLFFAWKGGWFEQKMLAYQAWLHKDFWSIWLAKRKSIQATRKISDRTLLKESTVGEILFQEASASSPIVRYVANPVLSLYRRVLIFLVRW
ncbi:glycosyltransferase family 2 protein [bacterium]|nr:glycosyltransferase family 2 protein [bacterium]